MKTLRPYGARLLVALLLTLVAYSTSVSSGSGAGTTWTLRVSGFNDPKSVTYENGLFVVVGWNGAILTSPDGANWTVGPSLTKGWLSGVIYSNNIFVAVGKYRIILTSP